MILQGRYVRRRLRTDVISEWSVAASKAATASGMPPLRTPITFALLHLAMYDAVNGHSRRSRTLCGRAAGGLSRVGAGRCDRSGLPSAARGVSHSRGRTRRRVPEPPGSRARPPQRNGIAVGAAVAQQLLALRANDGRIVTVRRRQDPVSGVWVPTPPAFLPRPRRFSRRSHRSRWRVRRSFVLRPSRARFEAVGRRLQRGKMLGASLGSTRTAEQTATALFWLPLAGAVWPASIRRLAREQGLDLRLVGTLPGARLRRLRMPDCVLGREVLTSISGVRSRPSKTAPLMATTSLRRILAWLPFATGRLPSDEFPGISVGPCLRDRRRRPHDRGLLFSMRFRIPARNIVSGEVRFFRKAQRGRRTKSSKPVCCLASTSARPTKTARSSAGTSLDRSGADGSSAYRSNRYVAVETRGELVWDVAGNGRYHSAGLLCKTCSADCLSQGATDEVLCSAYDKAKRFIGKVTQCPQSGRSVSVSPRAGTVLHVYQM